MGKCREERCIPAHVRIRRTGARRVQPLWKARAWTRGAFATFIAQLAAVGFAYYATGRLGLLVGVLRGEISPLWPPSGIALAAMLVLGARVWPGLLAGSILIKAELMPLAPALLSGVGSLLGPVCAYFLLRRIGFSTKLERQKDALALVFLGALAAMLVSSTVGTIVIVSANVIPAHQFLVAWFTWWTGDAMGVLAFTPLLLQFRHRRWPRYVYWRRLAEAIILLLGSLVCFLASLHLLNAAFVAFPLIGWAAVRFGLAGAAPVGLVISVIDTVTAVHGVGPYLDETLLTRMVVLQLFNSSAVLGGLFLAVTIMEREHARWTIEQTADRLNEVINHLEQSRTTPTVADRTPPPKRGRSD
nr:MASE1 domain-containing protein [Actinopolymorpha rutila]